MAQINLGHVVGQGVPSGGTAGQILKKNGSTNFDTSWATLDGSMVPVSASDSTTVQQSLAAVKSDMGIVEDGNTATHTISAGQYVIWKGALYTASAAIPAGTTLSTSNLTAVSGGGLNALNGKIGKLDGSTAYASGVDANSYTTSGVYHVGITSNSPTGSTAYGILEVEAVNGGRVTQRFTGGDGVPYSRQRYDSTHWGTWQELALKSNINKVKEHWTSVYTDAVSITTGTIGTRGAQVPVDIPEMPSSGAYILGVLITSIQNSAYDNVQAFLYDGKVYFNFYRCVETAHTNSAYARVFWVEP